MSRIYKGGVGPIEAFDWGGRPNASDAVRPLLAARETRDQVSAHEAPAPPEPRPVDLDAVRKQAFQEGYEAGRESALEESAAAHAELERSFARTLAGFADEKRLLRAAVEREVVELAFGVARRILRREISVDPRAAAGIVRSCLDEATAGEVRRVRVHPDQAEVVREAAGTGVEVVPDLDLEPGGAILETGRGSLDARIDTQLQEIERGLADR